MTRLTILLFALFCICGVAHGYSLEGLFGANPYRQQANTKDEDPTGLLNEGFRYRDLKTGSFITRDPLGMVDGPNLYTYVNQNPWTYFDPRGLSYWSDVGDFYKGYGDFAKEAASGVWDAVSNPAQTAQAAYSAITNPVETAGAMLEGAKQFGKDLTSGDARTTGKAFAGLLSSAVPAAKAGQAAKGLFKLGKVPDAPGLKPNPGSDAASLLNKTSKGLKPAASASDDVAGAAAKTTTDGKRSKMTSHPDAQGDHTVFKTDENGNVTHYQEFNKPTDTRNPNPFEPSKRVDTQHSNPHTHRNKKTGENVPTPHAHDPATPGGARPATPDELPK